MSTQNTPLRAAIYGRISLGTEESVSLDTQLAETRALAESKGWQVVRVITDETVSAFKKAPWQRPGLGPWLGSPDADVLIGWKLDRVIRRMSDLWKLHGILTDAGIMLVTKVDQIDMTTTQGQMLASILAGQAQTESENTSLRQQAARARQIDAGRIVGGKRPWPLQSVPNPNGPGKVWRPIPARARALRDAAAALTLHRTSLLAVCRAWNADPELRPNSGANWQVTPLRTLLTNPVIAGATIRHRDSTPDGILRNDDGTVRIDPDRAILSWDEFTRLKHELDGWARRKNRPRGGPTLLGGVLYCDHCKSRMVPNRSDRYPRYQCGNPTECTRQSTANMKAADAYMTDYFLDDLGDRTVYAATEAPADSADVATLREAIASITADMQRITSGDDANDWERLPELRGRRTELQERLDTANAAPKPIVLRETGETYAQRWKRADTAERNEMLREAYHIMVKQAGRGRRFSSANLDIHLRDEWGAEHG